MTSYYSEKPLSPEVDGNKYFTIHTRMIRYSLCNATMIRFWVRCTVLISSSLGHSPIVARLVNDSLGLLPKFGGSFSVDRLA